MDIEEEKNKIIKEQVENLKSEYLKGNFKNAFYNLLQKNGVSILKANLKVIITTAVLQELNEQFPNNNEIEYFLKKFEKINFHYNASTDIMLEICNLML